MLKILYVIENIFFGDGERAFSQIINGLDKEKYRIYIACLPGGIFEEKIKASAVVIPFNLSNRFNLVNIYKLLKIMKKENIQIVHSQGGRGDRRMGWSGQIDPDAYRCRHGSAAER